MFGAYYNRMLEIRTLATQPPPLLSRQSRLEPAAPVAPAVRWMRLGCTDGTTSAHAVTAGLARLFSEMRQSSRSVSTLDLSSAFGWRQGVGDLAFQQDVQVCRAHCVVHTSSLRY